MHWECSVKHHFHYWLRTMSNLGLHDQLHALKVLIQDLTFRPEKKYPCTRNCSTSNPASPSSPNQYQLHIHGCIRLRSGSSKISFVLGRNGLSPVSSKITAVLWKNIPTPESHPRFNMKTRRLNTEQRHLHDQQRFFHACSTAPNVCFYENNSSVLLVAMHMAAQRKKFQGKQSQSHARRL